MRALMIVPAFNEGSNIEKVLISLKKEQPFHSIVVINDGSIDDTAERAALMGVEVLSHPCNLGYGAALQTGYRYAARHSYDCVVQIDADGQHSPQDVTTLLAALSEGDADIVIGSRYKGDASFQPGLAKGFVIRFFRKIIFWIGKQNVSDPTSGLRALNRAAFSYYSQSAQFPADYPDADFLIDACLRGWKIKEVGISNQKRTSGRSMHSGLRPFVYLLKVSMSIMVNLLVYLLDVKQSVQSVSDCSESKSK